MRLSKINFTVKPDEPGYWEIQDVLLGDFNLIVASNATGKTRFLNIISTLAKIFTNEIDPFNGSWRVEFKDEQIVYRYELEINHNIIVKEILWSGNNLLLKRHKDTGKIYSFEKNETLDFSPPQNEITLNVRKSIKEYPYLESLYSWAYNLLRYNFSGVIPQHISIPYNRASLLENLNTIPYLLRELIEDKEVMSRIVKDVASMGYEVEGLGVKTDQMGFNELCMISIKEKDLVYDILQPHMSDGMFRALSLLIIMEHILSSDSEYTVLVDDINEGLDYDRSSKLLSVLLNKIHGTNVQLILTTNDRNLINSVAIKYINLFERHGSVIKVFNHSNSKGKYGDFILSRLDKIYN